MSPLEETLDSAERSAVNPYSIAGLHVLPWLEAASGGYNRFERRDLALFDCGWGFSNSHDEKDAGYCQDGQPVLGVNPAEHVARK
jgi:hypothetical protein